MTSIAARRQLERLVAEHTTAVAAGLDRNSLYTNDLEADLAASREAYVGLAVTEIATLRGELFGRQGG